MSFFGWGKEQKKVPQRRKKHQKKQSNNSRVKNNVSSSNVSSSIPKLSDDEIFKSIEEDYSTDPNDKSFDPLANFLENFTEEYTANDLEKLIAKRESQLSVINSKLYAQVIDNYDKFVQGMVQIRELGVDLETTVHLCKNGRNMLKKTDKDLITAPVKIISHNRKRMLYRTIINYLNQIKIIQNTESELKSRLSDGDYPAAIQLSRQFAKDLEDYKQFTCIQSLAKDAMRYENLIQQKLDDSLLEVTRSFSENSYERLLKAYYMSGKLHRVIKKLQQSFTDSVISGTHDLLYAHVLISDENAGKAESLKKLPFAELTSKLAEENFMACLERIFEYLVELMYSHYQMREWHLKIENSLETIEDDQQEELQYKDIRLGIERFSKVVWDQMQRYIVLLLMNSSLTIFKIEPFLAVLDAVSKLIEFGEEFSSSPATQLHTCLLQESRKYFQNYHKKKLEDLRTMVENEHWEAMPVHSGYSPVDIKEIRYFVNQNSSNNNEGSFSTPHSSTILQRNISSHGDISALASLASTGNPFSAKQLNRKNEVDSDDEDEELKQDYIIEDGVDKEVKPIKVDEIPEEEIGHGASVTIVCVNLVRYIGNYLQMMKILQSISSEVFNGVTQLYEYYLYIVFYFFSSKPTSTTLTSGLSLKGQSTTSFNYHSLFQRNSTQEVETSNTISLIDSIDNPKLKRVFGNIHKTFFIIEGENQTTTELPLPKISSELDIQSSNSMYGLKYRTVALESLEFLAHCMKSVQNQVLQLLPRNFSENCNAFYQNYVEIVPTVRDVIMEAMSERLVNVNDIPLQIVKVKWNNSDISSDHSPYVNTLIEEFRLLTVKLQQVVLQEIVSHAEAHYLFKKCIGLAMEQLVEGYSRVKKCSYQGRTLMSLDLSVFVTSLENIAKSVRPIPKKDHVEMYIKAFYEQNLIEWIKTNQDKYTSKQLLGLAVSVSGNLEKKQSKELFKAVDEISSKKKH